MSEQQTPNMTPVDALVCDENLQAMKACIPFMGPGEQSFVLAFTKFMEFRQSLQLIRKDTRRLQACSIEPALRTPVHMLNHIKPYCTDNQRRSIESLLSCFQMLQLYQVLQSQGTEDSAAESSQTEDAQTSSYASLNPSDYLKELLTPAQQQMFRQFSETVQQAHQPGPTHSTGGDNAHGL